MSGVVAAGGILANTAEQDGPLDPFEGDALLEPAAGQDFVGGGKDSLDARPGQEQFFQSYYEGLGKKTMSSAGCGRWSGAAATASISFSREWSRDPPSGVRCLL